MVAESPLTILDKIKASSSDELYEMMKVINDVLRERGQKTEASTTVDKDDLETGANGSVELKKDNSGIRASLLRSKNIHS